MTEHLGAIVAGLIAAVGAVGAMLIGLVWFFAKGKAASDQQTITVLKEATKDLQAEAARNRDLGDARHQKYLEHMAAVSTALSELRAKVDILISLRTSTGRSGQTPAVRLDDGGGR